MEIRIKNPFCKRPPPPTNTWIADGNHWALHEDDLIGDRKGLKQLRDAIDVALTSEDGRCELLKYWFAVRVVSEHPDIENFKSGKVLRIVTNIVGLAFILFFVFCAFYGFSQIPNLFR
jgi:hypothetical protein